MEWQPIETAPKDGTWVLGFGNGSAIQECSFIIDYDEDEGWLEVYSDVPCQPTHWMQLPEPPEVKQ